MFGNFLKKQKNFIIKHKLTFIEFKEFMQSLCLHLSIFVSKNQPDRVDKGLKVQTGWGDKPLRSLVCNAFLWLMLKNANILELLIV